MKLITKASSWMLAALALWSGGCTSDIENIVSDGESSGRTVHFTVAASREEMAQSRTQLTENSNGGLDCKWTKGDKIVVADESGNLKGILSLKNFIDNNESKAYFEGDLMGVNNGKVNLNYYYVGTKMSESDEELAKISTPYIRSYSEQDGKFESLTDYDILSAKTEAIVSDGASYVDITLDRRISAARFTLNNLPENFKGDVVISGDGVMNTVTLPLTDHKVKTSASPEGSGITMRNVGKEFYMVLLPNELAEGFDMKFSTVVNGFTYEGVYHVGKAIGEAKYYRKSLGDNNFGGLPVDMAPKMDEYKLVYDANFANANPGTKEMADATLVNGQPQFTLLAYDATEMQTRRNFTFLGWNADSNATQASYQPAAIFTPQKGENTLYAIWEIEYKLTFDLNGAAGNAPGAVSQKSNADSYTFTNLPAAAREGYDFLGWADTANATTGAMAYTVTSVEPQPTLYAVWKLKDPTVVAPGADGDEL